MSAVAQTEEIDIQDYMNTIRKMAARGLRNMNNRSGYTLDDMIGEGILVFYKDALPHYIRKGQTGHRSSFRSYLTTCLRNHFFGLMKSSFRQAVNDDVFEMKKDDDGNPTGQLVQVREDPKAVYNAKREAATLEMSPDEQASFHLMMEDIREDLTPRETEYLGLAMIQMTPKEIKDRLGVSSTRARMIRRGLQKKMRTLAC